MKRSILQFAMILSVISGLFVPAVSRAADAKPLNLITSPLPINISAKPGTSVATDLRVKQGSGDTETLKVTLMKFSAFGDTGRPRLLDRQPGDDYFDWVKFDKVTFTAPNNVWQTVKMTVNVPKTAAFGYYYAVVFSRVGDDVRQSDRTNSINGGTAVLVLLDAVVPNAKRSLSLDSFLSIHRIYEFLPATFNVKLFNDGNVHAVPHGNIFILQGKKQIAVLNLNDEQGNILPNSKRVYPVDWNDGFPVNQPVVVDGKVKLDKNQQKVTQLVWDWSQLPKFRMGLYTAHLFAVYDDGTRDVPIESTISFWVIPWRFLIGLFIVISIIGFGIYAAIRGAWRGARRIGNRR